MEHIQGMGATRQPDMSDTLGLSFGDLAIGSVVMLEIGHVG